MPSTRLLEPLLPFDDSSDSGSELSSSPTFPGDEAAVGMMRRLEHSQKRDSIKGER